MNEPVVYHPLQEHLGYQFQDQALLVEALRHSSFVNEQPDNSLRDNERLEFLGDAVLNMGIGHLLMRAYPELREGDLSRIRANMVNEKQLSDIARRMELGLFLQLGKGEAQSGGQEKNSILANALEALIAAVYLDGGFAAAFAVMESHFQSLVDAAQEQNFGHDFKSRLQEAVQGKIRGVPRYRVVEETGPDHDKTFRVVVSIGEMESYGMGKSKKLAEQEAARKALEVLNGGT